MHILNGENYICKRELKPNYMHATEINFGNEGLICVCRSQIYLFAVRIGNKTVFNFVPPPLKLPYSAGGSIVGQYSRRNRGHGERAVLTDTSINFNTRGATALALSGGGGTIPRLRMKTT